MEISAPVEDSRTSTQIPKLASSVRMSPICSILNPVSSVGAVAEE